MQIFPLPYTANNKNLQNKKTHNERERTKRSDINLFQRKMSFKILMNDINYEIFFVYSNSFLTLHFSLTGLNSFLSIHSCLCCVLFFFSFSVVQFFMFFNGWIQIELCGEKNKKRRVFNEFFQASISSVTPVTMTLVTMISVTSVALVTLVIFVLTARVVLTLSVPAASVYLQLFQ